jgi:septum formation protein
LNELGIRYDVYVPTVEEVERPSAADTVRENAVLKVNCAGAHANGKRIVLGADTVLAVNGHIFGKPKSPEDALNMLRSVSGRAAEVFTGIAAMSAISGKGVAIIDKATIQFEELDDPMAEWYIATGEPLTRAGAIGISLRGELFTRHVEGAFSCIAGLSKHAVLLACSDPILGDDRLRLDESFRVFLSRRTVNVSYFFRQHGLMEQDT